MRQKNFTVSRDVMIILLLLLLALAAWLVYTTIQKQSDVLWAEIFVGGELVATLSLAEEQTYSPPELPQVELVVQDDRVGFVHSDCPDQVCVHTGFLHTAGQFAACLPNKVVLRVAAVETPETDAVAG